MHLLEVPAVLAGHRIECNDRRGKQVVAGTNGTVEIRPGISRREIDQAERRVDRRRLPDGRAAVAPDIVVLGPSVVPELAGPRHGKECPDQRAVVGIVGLYAAAHAKLGAGKARDDEAVVVQRRARDREALLPLLGLDAPGDFTRALIESDQPAVELAHVDLAVPERDTAIRPAAADGRDRGIELRFVGPDELAAIDVDGKDVIGAGRHEENAVIEQRLRFARVLRA